MCSSDLKGQTFSGPVFPILPAHRVKSLPFQGKAGKSIFPHAKAPRREKSPNIFPFAGLAASREPLPHVNSPVPEGYAAVHRTGVSLRRPCTPLSTPVNRPHEPGEPCHPNSPSVIPPEKALSSHEFNLLGRCPSSDAYEKQTSRRNMGSVP